ncbi:MAG: glycosyltransferase family 2 protein [Nitrospinae bacterium]|nr:glycosyltransferase family 2 protein [Nitrospinota bacterium]
MSADASKISVIVVNWNGKGHLDGCFNSLSAQSYPNVEVILVDNASTDGSVEFVRSKFPWVRIIENGKNLGFGSAVNKGILEAKGFFILFLNNDLCLEKNCLEELALTLEKRGVGAVVPKILFLDKPGFINSYGVEVNFLGLAWPKHIDEPDRAGLKMEETPCGGIFMARKSDLEEVGAFDEDLFLYHEDHDLSWRFRLAGHKIIVNPNARIYHKYHFNKNLDKFYHSEKNRIHLLLKNYEARTLFLILPAAALVEVAEIYFALLSGWVFKKIRSYFEIAAEMAKIISKRRIIQARRKVSDREITKLFSGYLRIGGIRHVMLDSVLSPILNIYWNFIKGII